MLSSELAKSRGSGVEWDEKSDEKEIPLVKCQTGW